MSDFRANETGHMGTYALTLALLLGSLTAFMYKVGWYDDYTPENTNAYAIWVQSWIYAGMILGPGTLFGLYSSNYKQIPERFSKFLAPRTKFFVMLPAVSTLLGGLALHLVDDLNVYWIAPATIGIVFPLTCLLQM